MPDASATSCSDARNPDVANTVAAASRISRLRAPSIERDASARNNSQVRGSTVAYESTAEPIKLGYLFDFVLPDAYPKMAREDLTQTFDLVFAQGLAAGLIDRTVELVFREVEGLPKGTVKAVIDAYGELVDEGC